MKARVKATGEIVEINESSTIYDARLCHVYNASELENVSDIDADYWTRLEHQYAGMAMQGILSCPEWNIVPREGVSHAQECALQAQEFAHALVKKVRYEENPKELEGLKKELEALKIEKTILENKIKLLKEERK